MMSIALYSFLFFLVTFIAIGLSSALKSQKSTHDFLLASQDTKPWLIALSAIATNNSGYMFIGMIGYSYALGLPSFWLLFGFLFGDLCISFVTHKKIRQICSNKNIQSYGELLSNWYGQNHKFLRILIGLITLIFLSTYAAAQFNAGSKALHTLFNWELKWGAIISAGIVLSYCFLGGIRASIWTDAIQSIIMITAMVLLTLVSIQEMGGITAYLNGLKAISPNYMALFPADAFFQSHMGKILFITGWLFAGIGVVGQPHIMIRFMSMDKVENLPRIRMYYYSWYFFFSVFTVFTGLSTRLLLPDFGANFDAELALPLLSQKLLPEVLIGLVLAGLFSATISTADSQILSCTAALTNDIGLSRNHNFYITKLSTILVAGLSLTIALYGSQSVFHLVLIAWSALASCFAPLLILFALGQKPSQSLSIFTMLSGLFCMFLSRWLGYNEYIYQAFYGIMGGFIAYIFLRIFISPKPQPLRSDSV